MCLPVCVCECVCVELSAWQHEPEKDKLLSESDHQIKHKGNTLWLIRPAALRRSISALFPSRLLALSSAADMRLLLPSEVFVTDIIIHCLSLRLLSVGANQSFI